MPDDLTAAPTDLHWLTIADASRLIERRRLSPVELTDVLIARAEALDPQLNAFLLPTPEKAREQARAAEREIMAGGYRGPLEPAGVCQWRIPKSYRADMRVDGIIFADDKLIEQIKIEVRQVADRGE